MIIFLSTKLNLIDLINNVKELFTIISTQKVKNIYKLKNFEASFAFICKKLGRVKPSEELKINQGS